MVPPYYKAFNICHLLPSSLLSTWASSCYKVALIWSNKPTKITLVTFKEIVLEPCM